MKKAVLVGINYPGTDHELRGCVNDVMAVNQTLINHLGFDDPKQIRMLTDNSATTDNIIDRLNWLVKDATPGDVLYFHYSGHGTQFIDMNYDTMEEPDGLDECIVPVDINWRDKMITDDTFKQIFSIVPEGVNLTVTLDCCHSGQGLRDFLPPLEMRDNLFGPTRDRVRKMPVDIANRGSGLELQPKPRGFKNTIDIQDQHGLLISGCRSDETSADAWIQPARSYFGALTYTMLSILNASEYNITYSQMIEQLNESLSRGGFTQHPELDGKSELFDKIFLSQF
jgi:hypothetical protein